MQQQKPGLAAQQGGGAQATATERRRMLKSPSAKELGRHRVQPMAPGKLGSAEDAAVYQSTTKLARQDTKKAQGAAGGAAEMQGRRVGQGPG